MYILNENEREYRGGDSGPKYLMKGPRMNFALIRFKAGESITAHYHAVMEENFFVLSGEIDLIVNGVTTRLKKGDFAHIEPGERHRFINKSPGEVMMTAALAPYMESDKYSAQE